MSLFNKMNFCLVVLITYIFKSGQCSEFPDRECCEQIYETHDPVHPALPTTTLPSSPSTLTGRSG